MWGLPGGFEIWPQLPHILGLWKSVDFRAQNCVWSVQNRATDHTAAVISYWSHSIIGWGTVRLCTAQRLSRRGGGARTASASAASRETRVSANRRMAKGGCAEPRVRSADRRRKPCCDTPDSLPTCVGRPSQRCLSTRSTNTLLTGEEGQCSAWGTSRSTVALRTRQN